MTKTATNGRFFELLAVAVASGSSVKSAAESCGCGERQAYRISAMPEFRRRVSEIRSQVLDSTVGKISNATSQAVDKLVSLLNDPHHSLGAAKAILSNVAPLSELGELRSRIDKLESGK